MVPLAMFAGCARALPLRCPPDTMRALQAQLYFGRDVVGRGMVSEEEWQEFLAAEVTPRFPDGLSVTDVSGQYRNAGGTILPEQSKALTIILRPGHEEQENLAAIRDSYKRRFNQESVLLVETPACVGF